MNGTGGSIKARAFAFVALAVVSVPISAREMIAASGGWAAFRDGSACLAVSRAQRWSGGPAPVAAFLVSPGKTAGQFSIRLGRPLRAARLTIDGRPVPLTIADGRARPAEAGGDALIRALIRAAALLTLEGEGSAGGRYVARFPLAGAPTALDAARLACPDRRPVWKKRGPWAISPAP